MRITEAARLFEYWGRSPPTHVMVAAYFGIDGSDSPSVKGKITDDGLIAMLGGREVAAPLDHMPPPPALHTPVIVQEPSDGKSEPH
jgi:hypothetical protein